MDDYPFQRFEFEDLLKLAIGKIVVTKDSTVAGCGKRVVLWIKEDLYR
jgi:hypothetical protein